MITAHADVVGSLLRPAELLRAREELAAGRITAEAFKEIEDRAVDWAVRLQEDSGVEVVTDGEMRRLSFQSQMTEAVEGFGSWDIDAFLWGEWHGVEGAEDWRRERPTDIGVVGKLVRKRYLSAGEFVYLRALTRCVPKITSLVLGCLSIFGRRRPRETPIRSSTASSPTWCASCAKRSRNSRASAPSISRSTPLTIPCSSTPRPGRSTNPAAGRSRSGST